MKNALFTLFRIAIALVLVGKILNWSLDFSDETNRFLNMTVFGLIGIAYIVTGFAWDQMWKRMLTTACGILLLVVNFFESRTVLTLLGLTCLLTPILLARLHQRKDRETNVQDNGLQPGP